MSWLLDLLFGTSAMSTALVPNHDGYRHWERWETLRGQAAWEACDRLAAKAYDAMGDDELIVARCVPADMVPALLAEGRH